MMLRRGVRGGSNKAVGVVLYCVICMSADTYASGQAVSVSSVPTEKANQIKSTNRASSVSEAQEKMEQAQGKSFLSKIQDWFNKPSSHKTINEMKFDELKAGKERHLAQGNISIALRYLDKMIPLCPDLHMHSELLFEQATMLMELKEFQRAATVFTEFATLYPSHVHAEEASFKAVKCQACLILSHDRDQSVTLQTLELAQEFLDRPQAFTQYRTEVEKIVQNCTAHLIHSECSIAEFYMKQKNFIPAQRRLTMVREKLLEKAPQEEVKVLHLECALAEAQGDKQRVEEKRLLLAEKFSAAPKSLGNIVDTRPSKSFAQRF